MLNLFKIKFLFSFVPAADTRNAQLGAYAMKSFDVQTNICPSTARIAV